MAKITKTTEVKTIVKPPVLYSETQRVIKKIEAKYNTRLLCYWNSVNGKISHSDVVVFYEIVKDMEMQDCLYLFIKSGGGSGQVALRIINLLRQHTKKLVAIIPGDCASAATMLALGADEIQMGPLAYLSAVDTSLTHRLSPVDKDNDSVSVGQDELARVLTLWNLEKKDADANPYGNLYQYIHPLVFGAVDRASSLSIKLCRDILSYHMKDELMAEKISKSLNAGYPSHNYPITLKEAERIGLNAKPLDKELNNLLFELNSLYSRMGQRALSDYDENNYHDHEIPSIIEANNVQIFYQTEKDWHYRSEERKYIPMNDKSSWQKCFGEGETAQPQPFQIR